MARHQPFASAAHAILPLILAAAVESQIDLSLTVLLVAFQVMAAIQMGIWYRHRSKPRPNRVSDRTIRRITTWAVMCGLLWGTYTATLLNQAVNHDCALIAVTIMGVSAGASAKPVFQGVSRRPKTQAFWAYLAWYYSLSVLYRA